MGQQESHVLQSEAVDTAEVRLRPRGKKETTRKRKTVKRSAPDQFMRRAEAVNHIKPIREEKAKEKEEETLEGIFDLAAKLKEKKKAAAEPLELQVMQLPEIEEEAATESEEEEEEDRGVYHKDVVTAPQQTNVTQPIAHPVAIEGECAVGDTLHFRDDSPYQREFPVNRIEWVESLSVGETTLFSIAPLAEGLSDTPLTIPPDLLGKYICVKAHRRVEDQLARTQFGAAEDGAYDQHVGGPRNIRTEPPKVYVPVVSTCIAGPVLLAEETALLILKALARGGFSCAVKLRDVLDSADRAVPLEQDPVKAAKAKHKIPATLIVDGSVLELRYLKEFITTDKDGCIRPSHIKEPTNADFATIERTLDLVSVRPSTGPKTLVVALEFKDHGYKAGGCQQLLRFDVDPAVGRDLALHQCLAFQAVRRARISRATLDSWFNMGNVQALRETVQDFLEAQNLEASEAVPAYEKMPTTPWSVLNYRP